MPEPPLTTFTHPRESAGASASPWISPGLRNIRDAFKTVDIAHKNRNDPAVKGSMCQKGLFHVRIPETSE